MAKQNHNPDSSQKQSPKLTPTQRNLLSDMQWHVAVVHGIYSGRNSVRCHGHSYDGRTLTALRDKKLVERLDGQDLYHTYQLSALGRAALLAADAESHDAPKDGGR